MYLTREDIEDGGRTRFNFIHEPWNDAYRLVVMFQPPSIGNAPQCKKVVTRVEVEDYHSGDIIHPQFSFATADMQRLADALWGLGFRPSDAGKPEGELSAMRDHLSDLRQLAFHVLKIPTVK